MNRAKWIWLASLGLVYASFWFWYGGNGDPLGQAEGEAMLAEIEQTYGADRGNLSEGRFLRNMREALAADDGKEFYAVNLEALIGTDEARSADQKYASIVFPQLARRAGHPVFVGSVNGLMLGDYGNQVDRVAVVRYRSLRDLLDMVRDPAFAEGEPYKMAALDHTEVFIIKPMISFVQVRLVVGMFLSLLGIAGLMVIGRWQRRPSNASAA